MPDSVSRPSRGVGLAGALPICLILTVGGRGLRATAAQTIPNNLGYGHIAKLLEGDLGVLGVH